MNKKTIFSFDEAISLLDQNCQNFMFRNMMGGIFKVTVQPDTHTLSVDAVTDEEFYLTEGEPQ